MFREDNNLRKGKTDWEKFLESRQSNNNNVLNESKDSKVPQPKATHPEDENPSDPELSGEDSVDNVPQPKATHPEDENPSDPKETKSIEAEELKEEDEIDMELSMSDPEDGPDTSSGVKTGDDGATPVSIGEEGTATGGIATNPQRMNISEMDMNRMDERTKNKMENLVARYNKMQEQMAELEEEMSYLKEMGEKQYTLDEMKNQMSSLKDEISSLKEQKKSPKKKVEDEEGDLHDVDPNFDKDAADRDDDGELSDWEIETGDEVAKSEKKESPKKKNNKKSEKKMDESYNKTMHKWGKIPGSSKSIDLIDSRNKKKLMVESGYQKYLKNRNPSIDSGEEPNGFSVVMG